MAAVTGADEGREKQKHKTGPTSPPRTCCNLVLGVYGVSIEVTNDAYGLGPRLGIGLIVGLVL